MIFLPIPAAEYVIGSSRPEILDCVERWRDRLQKINYTAPTFASWLEKEYPRHRVSVRAFDLGRTLVSHGDVAGFVRETDVGVPESMTTDPRPGMPVWGVSLEWAERFAAWSSARDPRYTYRLPTETEWEVAARGPLALQYAYGNEFDSRAANTCESQLGVPTPVEHYADHPGPFGHLDLSGNLEEWVSTPYYVYPGGTVINDDLYQRLGPGYAILRGGSFVCGGDLSRGARRHGPFPDPQYRYTGFRLVREVRGHATNDWSGP